ncbi:hypothetical protein CDAR_517781 [Caerostris darwini]|uniref:Uncharacterized protein n=1 Tax=Caerostris darwini TaxID=1538125 RepID=A0AAV4SZF0_9ARAC|nr:hypothetical protein CDAR_517781 [Caerostris darwini]
MPLRSFCCSGRRSTPISCPLPLLINGSNIRSGLWKRRGQTKRYFSPSERATSVFADMRQWLGKVQTTGLAPRVMAIESLINSSGLPCNTNPSLLLHSITLVQR